MCVLYTYTVSSVRFIDDFCTCIWTSFASSNTSGMSLYPSTY